jgi:hypothetical protein
MLNTNFKETYIEHLEVKHSNVGAIFLAREEIASGLQAGEKVAFPRFLEPGANAMVTFMIDFLQFSVEKITFF